jgi:transposase-like protein
MTKAQVEVITSVQRRRHWSRAEKEWIVAAAMAPGAVASEVARAAGIHSSQLFRWRQQLCERAQIPAVFNPVMVKPEPEAVSPALPEKAGVIEIEFASGGRMRISGPVDGSMVSALMNEGAGEGQAAAMIPATSGARVWLAAGHTEMRKGFDGLALLVQETLKRDAHSGHLFVFRGRRGGLIKVLWHDGQGLCLFAKRLERGRFIWPSNKIAGMKWQALLGKKLKTTPCKVGGHRKRSGFILLIRQRLDPIRA